MSGLFCAYTSLINDVNNIPKTNTNITKNVNVFILLPQYSFVILLNFEDLSFQSQ